MIGTGLRSALGLADLGSGRAEPPAGTWDENRFRTRLPPPPQERHQNAELMAQAVRHDIFHLDCPSGGKLCYIRVTDVLFSLFSWV